MEFKDYYAVLGIAPEADDKAIKTAYRKLARQYHPDVSSHADAENKFKEVAEAYQVLHNSEKRAEYDELRLARNQRQQYRHQSGDDFAGADQSNGDFADFFSSIFGSPGAQSGHYRSAEPFSRQGGDVEIELPVFLEETLTETTKSVRYHMSQRDQYGQLRDIPKSLKVKIHAGVVEGERIRLKGQGMPGSGNAASGDLYLHIRLVPHPLFDVEGHNLLITLPVAPWEAALGTKATLPTLTGHIQLTIPPGSQSGQRLRIKGKGLVGKHGQGDLFAILKVVMPEKTDPQINALWAQLADKSAFDPRAEWSK